MMRGFLTVCFSDWTKEQFSRRIMRLISGKKTDIPIRRLLRPSEQEGEDYYIKAEPESCIQEIATYKFPN